MPYLLVLTLRSILGWIQIGDPRVPLIKTGRFAVQHKLVEEMLCGSGKSVVGKALAQRLRYAFFDSDDVLESASGASVNEVINQVGIDEFRDLETQV